MPLLAFFCEARGDFGTGGMLLDRVLVGEIEWIRELLDGTPREWLEREPDPGAGPAPPGSVREWLWYDERPFIPWTKVKGLAARSRVRVHGGFGASGALPFARKTREAVLTAMKVAGERGQKLDGVVLLSDEDGAEERRRGFEQGREKLEEGEVPSIAIGVARPMREVWVMAGFGTGAKATSATPSGSSAS